MSSILKSPEWLREHFSRIGGSNAAAAVGLSPWKSPLALYYEMVEGHREDLEANSDVLRGTLLEPVARARLQTVMGVEVNPHDQDDRLTNAKYPWASGLPDGWVMWDGERIPVELKVPSPWNFDRLDEGLPDYIQCQAIHNLTICEAPALLVACLHPVSMAVWRNIFVRDEELIALLMEGEERFWTEHIVPRVPPDPTSESDLRTRWPRHSPGKTVVANADILETHGYLLTAQAEAKALNEAIERYKLECKRFMADSELLTDEYRRPLATYRTHTSRVLDQKALSAERPEIVEAYSMDRESRVFLPKRVE